jgi:hypothetical protein
MRRPTRAWIVAALALAAAAGGVAVAAPGDGATIFACTNNLRESIRFVDEGVACAAGETLMTWSKQGPAGPPGERGPQGAPGVTFERSPTVDAALTRAERSFAKKPRKLPKKVFAQLKAADAEVGEARAAYRDGPVQLPSKLGEFLGLTPSQAPLVVASLPLPAGRWVVQAKAQAILHYDVHKAVAAAGATYDVVACQLRAGVDSDETSVSGFSGSIALQVVHSYATPGLVQVECYGLLEPKLSDVKITAIRVAKVKNQPVTG